MPLLKDETMALEPPRLVYVTHDINMTNFAVTISRFQPGLEDTTSYTCTDATGNKREYDLPPYYI